MVDMTLAHPEGILEDVLIKVGKFFFLVDFVVINMEEDKQDPLLLGRPFLATGPTLIDVKKKGTDSQGWRRSSALQSQS